MRVDERCKVDQIKDDEAVRALISKFAFQVINAINGNLTFSENINCKLVVTEFTSANTDTIVRHNLGRVPLGYILMGATAAMSVYDGTTTNSDSSQRIFLKSSAVGTARLIVF